MVKFDATFEENMLIKKIAKRLNNPSYDYLDLVMDLEAVHSNGCPLDFQKLLDFPDFDFSHDVYGIRKHIDRTTGTLTDCFCPRCSKAVPTPRIPKLRIKIGEGQVRFTTENGNEYFTDMNGGGLWHGGIMVADPDNFNVRQVSRDTMRRRFLKIRV